MKSSNLVGKDVETLPVWHEDWNVQLQQSMGQSSGSENNHVNSVHSEYKQWGKYSTSSLFKTWVTKREQKKATNALFFFFFLNLNQSQTTIITLIYFEFFSAHSAR